MEITREKHWQYMTKLTPILAVAVVIQSYLYFRYFPHDLAQDITVFLGIGLSMILGFFGLHNHFHQVELKPNYLRISIKPLKYEEEIVYRDVTGYEVTPSKHGFSTLKLELKDGRSLKIFYVDEVDRIVSNLKKL